MIVLCTSPVIRDVCMFHRLFATYVTSLLECLLKFCSSLKIGSFGFLLSFESSLYILDTSVLSGTCFAYNIFSQSVAYLFVLLTVSFEEQTF